MLADLTVEFCLSQANIWILMAINEKYHGVPITCNLFAPKEDTCDQGAHADYNKQLLEELLGSGTGSREWVPMTPEKPLAHMLSLLIMIRVSGTHSPPYSWAYLSFCVYSMSGTTGSAAERGPGKGGKRVPAVFLAASYHVMHPRRL